MTMTAERNIPADVTYGLSDADQHYYEHTDAGHPSSSKQHRHAIHWIEIDGRKTLLVNNKLLTLIPNPTYDPVGQPGSLEMYFRAQNHDGKEIRDIIEMGPIPPAARDRDARVKLLDEQKVDLAWVMPSLGLGLEEMMADNPEMLYAAFHSYNQWLDEDWGYNRDGRIITGPLMSLIDPDKALAELNHVIGKGARIVTFRPAPVHAPDRYRSLADPLYDRFWHTAADAGVTIAFHGADSGYGIYLERWGESQAYTGMKMSALSEVMGVHVERPVYDLIASLICHGLFDRVPNLKVATVELGAGWVGDLARRLKRSYGKTPQLYKRDQWTPSVTTCGWLRSTRTTSPTCATSSAPSRCSSVATGHIPRDWPTLRVGRRLLGSDAGRTQAVVARQHAQAVGSASLTGQRLSVSETSLHTY